MTVTRRLSEAADAAVGAAVDFLSARPAPRATGWRPMPPATSCSAMGKYGAFELNYSSDIDLIVFYDRARMRLRAGLEIAAFLRAPDARSRAPAAGAHRRRLRLPHRSAPAPRSRRHAARALDRRRAQLLRELRPELGACRPHQGARRGRRHSRPATSFLAELAPFIWRKYLDFAAIADIHAMKRQIHAFRGFGDDRASPATTSSSAAAASARSSSSSRPSS